MRRFLTPGWVTLHVFVVAFLVASVLLAVWQWDRAQSAGGGAQNLAYALQWPVFGLFGVFMWWRLLRLERRRDAEHLQPAAQQASVPDPRPQPVPPRNYPVAADIDDEEVDEDLAAYNRMLAKLAERSRHVD